MSQPMNIYEAIEMMKIVGPHSVKVSRAAFDKTGAAAIAVLLKETREASPINFLRMAALMEHKDIEEVAEEYRNLEPRETLHRLADLFNVNPLADLMNGAWVLGLTERGWIDGERTN